VQVRGAAGGRPAEVVSPEWTSREVVLLAALALGAALVRAWRWHLTSLMFNDGPSFLALSQLMEAGGWVEALRHPYHPLYPFLTLVAHFAVSDWELAAAGVSIVAGAASVACLFAFLRSAFGRTEAWVGAAFLAVQPRAVSNSADVLSDGLYLALFLAGAALLWSATRRPSRALAGWAGVFAGLAYLTRPEGAGILLVGVACAALAVLLRRWSPWWALGWLAALCAAALLVMLPYLTFLRVERGSWIVTQKKNVGRLITGEGEAAAAPLRALPPGTPTRDEARAWPLVAQKSDGTTPVEARVKGLPHKALGDVLAAASASLRPWFLALLLVGVFLRRGRPGAAGAFVLLFLGLYAAVLFHLDYRYGYVDARHTLPPLALAFGYLAPGCLLLGRGILGALARLRPALGTAAPGRAVVVGAAVVLAVALGQTLRPERAGAAADRAAAAWLRTQPTAPGAVAATKGRLAYYAGRPYVSLYTVSPTGLIERLRERGARFVIVDDQKLAEFPELAAAPDSALRLVHRAEDRGRWTGVYELAPERIAPAGSLAPVDAAAAGGAP
jgi:4-amino-4-deoxy-L-arabinose transferase-like glycosyltransferase